MDYCSVNSLLKFNAKYTAMHISLLGGIHWGFAIANHDLQKNFLDSSIFNRIHFTLTSGSVMSALAISNYLCYETILLADKLPFLAAYSGLYFGIYFFIS